MKYFHLAFLFLMVLFALLQWNDIDRLIWLSIYLAAALLAFLTYKKNCQPCIIAWACLIIVFAGYMLIAVIPGVANTLEPNAYTDIFFSMHDKTYMEQTREALGLLIILFYSICILIQIYMKQRHIR